ATPVFISNTRLTTKPNAFYVNPGSTSVFVAEGGVSLGGFVSQFETYNVGDVYASTNGNALEIGVPTPGEGPVSYFERLPGTGVVNPQGLAYSLGWWATLDSPGVIGATGSAVMYEGDDFFGSGFPAFLMPVESTTTSYGSGAFKNPRSIAGDSAGNFYVADTGNHRVLIFSTGGYNATSIGTAIPRGAWTGSNTYNFQNPVAVACDSSNNVYVGDVADMVTGNSVVQEYASQATTIKGSWTLVPGCIINGLAIDGNGDFFVSDVGNGVAGAGQVEEYKILDSSHTLLLRVWGDPKSSNEFSTFYPSCIGLVGNASLTSITNILVGDQNNDMIQVFGP
ncbi:MAG TPA: NHL repeat-containing protein, partial [bacterium]|nr:NHL repeat-containing protein [bacterium]